MIKSRENIWILSTLALVALGLFGCQRLSYQSEISTRNRILADERASGVNRIIGESSTWFKVLGSDYFSSLRPMQETGAVELRDSLDLLAGRKSELGESALVVGFPLALLGEKFVFGGVITKVSDSEDEGLGRVKLASLSPIHVVPTLVGDADQQSFFLELTGCLARCTASSPGERILNIPIIGTDPSGEFAMLDLLTLGESLDLFSIINQGRGGDALTPTGSRLKEVDFSESTLVFDIESGFLRGDNTPAVQLTARWFLRQIDSFASQAFVSRGVDSRVGFFTSNRGEETKITRFGSPLEGVNRVKYYVKNVPAEFQGAFAGAFDDWNNEFLRLTGDDLIDYEFLAKDDPRTELVVAGDIRYNVVEWDVDNKAPYGGLGPSIADQLTGQTISATTLVQGPSIVELYRSWFDSQQQDEMTGAAQAVAMTTLSSSVVASYAISLAGLGFEVPGQNPDLEDPIARRLDFFDTPKGFSFETYMDGYFRELVAHELGHNLGLRHNFRGNLGAVSESGAGEVSRSVMEYLGRSVRHLNRVSAYDVMAISYGYAGVEPFAADWFCTDEDVPSAQRPTLSPECSRDDLGVDPYGDFWRRLSRAVDLLIGRGSASAPSWEISEMEREVSSATFGIGFYHVTADSSRSWTNWGLDREPVTIRELISGGFRELLCDDSIEEVVEGKDSLEARTLAAKNVNGLVAQITTTLTTLDIPITYNDCVAF